LAEFRQAKEYAKDQLDNEIKAIRERTEVRQQEIVN
jgi:tRNA A-37 threonylcarbamoyl transferase component Bud32